jgi:Leucine-rich repeat (LRR) protein
LTALAALVFECNQLTGPIPSEIGLLTALAGLMLGSNQLTGPIPSELGLLTALQYLELGSTQLTGPIPSEFGGLTKLYYLNLTYTQLLGSIPSALHYMYDLPLDPDVPSGLFGKFQLASKMIVLHIFALQILQIVCCVFP